MQFYRPSAWGYPFHREVEDHVQLLYIDRPAILRSYASHDWVLFGPFESLLKCFCMMMIIDQPEFKTNAWSWYWAHNTLGTRGFFVHVRGCIGWLIFEATIDETVTKRFLLHWSLYRLDWSWKPGMKVPGQYHNILLACYNLILILFLLLLQ